VLRREVKEGYFKANDLPAIPGVQYAVYYRKDNPSWSYVDFETLSSITLKKYINRLRVKMQLKYDLYEEDIRVDCLCIQTFNNFGVEGLANLFYCDVPLLQNFSNNQRTFKTMEETTQYQRILKDCLITPQKP